MSNDLFVQIFGIIFPLLAVVLIGVGYGLVVRPTMDIINRVNLDVFIPALILASLTNESFALKKYSTLAISAVVIVLISGLLAIPLARLLRIQTTTLAPSLMFHNAGNIGLPLFVLAYGEQGVALGLVLFLVGSLLHFSLGTYLLNQRQSWTTYLMQPVIIAAIVAIIINATNMTLPTPLMRPLAMLGNIAAPLLLFSLGVRLSEMRLTHWKLGLAGAILTPVVGVGLAYVLATVLHLQGAQMGALLIFGALPPAVLNFVFAEQFHKQPAVVASIVMLGNMISIVTLPLILAYVLPRYV